MKTALIGLGRIGWQYHLPQIVKHEGFELAAVVDTNPERLREAEVAYGIRGYADAAEMLLYLERRSPCPLGRERLHSLAARIGADGSNAVYAVRGKGRNFNGFIQCRVQGDSIDHENEPPYGEKCQNKGSGKGNR